MLLHRGFPTTTTDRTICALSLAPSRAPYRARARARLREATQPAPRADPPGASGQRDMPVRVRPDTRVRVQGDCRRERAPRCGARQRRRHKALERESPQGAQPTGIPAGVETRFILARNGRGRCGERPHARNGRSRATRRAAAASGAGRHVHTCPAGHVARWAIYSPGGFRKGEAASVVPRPRKHRRHEARSVGRGMPSGRGLSRMICASTTGSVTYCLYLVDPRRRRPPLPVIHRVESPRR